ncbi:helix-turn-helix domain-containing protein [Actinomadura formosensis]|uniref:helix-turn-helix domain-containing protein n=1 Tax=Actinomadura formosensis TaxID=60706 RepID=UPI000B12059D|nr:helix-turn-helix domain-containing protein [Actinomadura formosensis]
MSLDDLTPDSLLDQGLTILRDLLGPGWEVTIQPTTQEAGGGRRRLDALVQMKADGDSVLTQLVIDLKRNVSPRLVEEQLLPKWDLLRQVNHYTNLLVIAPWIAPRVQLLLREHGIGYVDLTGNVSLRVSRPAVAIYTQGASRSPRSSTTKSSKATLAGLKAGRLVRLLTDVAPPYRATELANAAGLSLPYVSRLLDTLEDQLLIRREGRIITYVDWPQLLRVRAEHYTLLRQNSYVGMVAPNGIDAVFKALRALPGEYRGQIALTGSYAARTVAPLAVGGQLMLYLPAGAPRLPDEIGDELGLLRVDRGADVLLLRAHDPVVFERTVDHGGVRRVALSQLALDCLSGPGRMPAEGEAVLSYMRDNPRLWQLDRLRS